MTDLFGVNRANIERLSALRCEPAWMQNMRLCAFDAYQALPMPVHLNRMQQLLDAQLCVHACPVAADSRCSRQIVFEAAARGLQIESQMVCQELMARWRDQGVIFCHLSAAVHEHPEIIRRFLGHIVAPDDNKYAALTRAFWTGGVLVYVPAGVQVCEPIDLRYFIGQQGFGQFEQSVIIADSGSSVSIVEGCASALGAADCVHAGVVEVYVGASAQVRYLSMQTWSDQVYHVATKRALVQADGSITWTSIAAGSRVSCMVPTSVLAGPGAQAQVGALTMARAGQSHYGGARVIHRAPHTQSSIISRSIVGRGGLVDARARIKVEPDASNVCSYAACHARLCAPGGHVVSVPELDIQAHDAQVSHEAGTSRLSAEQLFYLMSRGLDLDQAQLLATIGFADAVLAHVPVEVAVEVERLIGEICAGQNPI